MTLAIDVQSWYALHIIKDIIVNPNIAYSLLKKDKNAFIRNIKNSIIRDTKNRFLHPEIQIFTTTNHDKDYFLFDIPVVDKRTDKHIYIIANFQFKEKLFSKELISSSATKLVQEFFDENLFEANIYTSLPSLVMLDAKNLGFIFVENIHSLIDDMISFIEDVKFSSRWLWYADPHRNEEQDLIYLKNTEYLHSKYKDFENKKLFDDINQLVGLHSLLIVSVFSMLTKFKILSPDQCESNKQEFQKLFSNCYVLALFLGLDRPWNQSATDNNYYVEIRRIINILVNYSFKAIRESIELLPKGNNKGIVELSVDVYGSIRQIIEWTYWFSSEYMLSSPDSNSG